MQCYCDNHWKFEDMASQKVSCKNIIPYVHHHDWSSAEDYMCEDCLNNCEEK